MSRVGSSLLDYVLSLCKRISLGNILIMFYTNIRILQINVKIKNTKLLFLTSVENMFWRVEVLIGNRLLWSLEFCDHTLGQFKSRL